MKVAVARVLVLGVLSMFIGVGSARASTITVEYYTTGVFCTSAACSTTLGTSVSNVSTTPPATATVSFAGAGSVGSPLSLSNPDAGSTGQSFGQFTVSLTGTANVPLPTNYFQLSIFQSLPSIGNDELVGQLSGQIKSTGELDFTSSAVTIGIVSYALTDPLVLNPIANNETKTFNLTGTISHEDVPIVPEPTSILLLGSGLIGLGAVLRRHRGETK